MNCAGRIAAVGTSKVGTFCFCERVPSPGSVLPPIPFPDDLPDGACTCPAFLFEIPL
jgi:hypothetical protein